MRASSMQPMMILSHEIDYFSICCIENPMFQYSNIPLFHRGIKSEQTTATYMGIKAFVL
jgi:hypothetical protein